MVTSHITVHALSVNAFKNSVNQHWKNMGKQQHRRARQS